MKTRHFALLNARTVEQKVTFKIIGGITDPNDDNDDPNEDVNNDVAAPASSTGSSGTPVNTNPAPRRSR